MSGHEALPLTLPMGTPTPVCEGVYCLPLPLGSRLAAVNSWILADGEGWTVVDSGLYTPETTEAWTAALAGPLSDRPLRRVIVTHMHADHCGAAGWLAQTYGAALWMTRLEYLSAARAQAGGAAGARARPDVFYRLAGWTGEMLAEHRPHPSAGLVAPLPHDYRRIHDGETIPIGGRDWKVIVGSGHSPEHACLYCPELALFISGDQVLQKISSNVSLQPDEPESNPLAEWLDSLERIRREALDDVVVLPAHGPPFRGLHARVGELISDCRRSLGRLGALLEEPRRAVDTFEVLFKRPVEAPVLGLATGEALAHLNYLRMTGAVRRADGDGVWWWRKSA